MGILGSIELVKRTRDVVVGITSEGDPFSVSVCAPRLQLIPDLRRKLPDPKPPAKRDDQGRVVLRRHPSTGEVIKKNGQSIPELDVLSKEFLNDVANVERARTIAMIFECITLPGETAVVQDGLSPVAYQLARWRELEEAGFDVGAYKSLSDACVDLSDPMSRTEIEDARYALGTDKQTQIETKEQLREEGKPAPKGK